MAQSRLSLLFWILFALAGALYLAIVLWSLPRVMAEAGGAMPFDLRPAGYDLAEARGFLMALSDAGRAFYLGTQHWLDTAYPPLLAVSIALGARLVFRLSVARVLGGIAVIGMVADLYENHLVAELLRGTPAEPDPALVMRASLATLIKSIANTIGLSALSYGAVRSVWRRWRG